MSDPILRLNAALEGRYRIERELGEGDAPFTSTRTGAWTTKSSPHDEALAIHKA